MAFSCWRCISHVTGRWGTRYWLQNKGAELQGHFALMGIREGMVEQCPVAVRALVIHLICSFIVPQFLTPTLSACAPPFRGYPPAVQCSNH